MNKDEMVMDNGLSVTTCYTTSDGEVFEDFKNAKNHQNRYNFCEGLADYLLDTRCGSDVAALVTDTIMEDLDSIAEVFKIYLEATK